MQRTLKRVFHRFQTLRQLSIYRPVKRVDARGHPKRRCRPRLSEAGSRVVVAQACLIDPGVKNKILVLHSRNVSAASETFLLCRPVPIRIDGIVFEFCNAKIQFETSLKTTRRADRLLKKVNSNDLVT